MEQDVNNLGHAFPTRTVQCREINDRWDSMRIDQTTLATQRRAREKQGNALHGLPPNAIDVGEKDTMAESANVLKT